MEFFAANLTLILCGLAGLALLVTEAIMPGFGIAGILGAILEIIAIYSAYVQYGLVTALILTLLFIILLGVVIFLSYRSAMKGRISRSDLILKDAEEAAPEPAAKTLQVYLNREGVTVSALRPGGTVEIDGVRINAASGGELVEKGEKVLVTGTEGDHVIVRRA